MKLFSYIKNSSGKYFTFLKDNKNTFLSAFLFIFVITMINKYFQSSVNLSEIESLSNNIDSAPQISTKFTLSLIFSIIPMLFFPVIFSFLLYEKKAGIWNFIKTSTSPLRSFSFYLSMLTMLMMIPLLASIYFFSFKNTINENITAVKEYQQMIEERSKSNNPEELKITDEDREFVESIEKLVNGDLRELRVAEESKVRTYVGLFLSLIVLTFFSTLYTVASAITSTFYVGYLSVLRITFKSYLLNIKYIIIGCAAWVVMYLFANTIFSYIESKVIYDVVDGLTTSIINTLIISYAVLVIFLKVINNKRIMIPTTEKVRLLDLKSKKIQEKENISIRSFESILINNNQKDKTLDENEEQLNNLRK